MKKHLIILSLIIYVCLGCFLLSNSSSVTTVSTENKIQYGQIINNNVMLLKTPTKVEDSLNSYFLLEESYFVIVLNNYDTDFYYVNYLNFNGYIKKSDINLVNEQIENPFLKNITFDVIKQTNLYSEPKNNPNLIIDNIAPQEKINYIGKIYGNEVGKNSGNVWYFCSITQNSKEIYGYIHSSFTNNLSPIIQNNEVTSTYINQDDNINLLNLNLKTQSLIIVTISLPIIFLLFIFLKGFKKV